MNSIFLFLFTIKSIYIHYIDHDLMSCVIMDYKNFEIYVHHCSSLHMYQITAEISFYTCLWTVVVCMSWVEEFFQSNPSCWVKKKSNSIQPITGIHPNPTQLTWIALGRVGPMGLTIVFLITITIIIIIIIKLSIRITQPQIIKSITLRT